jgi:hypothetical protein
LQEFSSCGVGLLQRPSGYRYEPISDSNRELRALRR